LEELSVYGRIILKHILKTLGNSVQWVHLAVDRDKWRAILHMAMDQLRIPKSRNFSFDYLTISFSTSTVLHVVS